MLAVSTEVDGVGGVGVFDTAEHDTDVGFVKGTGRRFEDIGEHRKVGGHEEGVERGATLESNVDELSKVAVERTDYSLDFEP